MHEKYFCASDLLDSVFFHLSTLKENNTHKMFSLLKVLLFIDHETYRKTYAHKKYSYKQFKVGCGSSHSPKIAS
jgi:hypothetical protein